MAGKKVRHMVHGEWLTVAEVAARVGVTERWINRWRYKHRRDGKPALVEEAYEWHRAANAGGDQALRGPRAKALLGAREDADDSRGCRADRSRGECAAEVRVSPQMLGGHRLEGHRGAGKAPGREGDSGDHLRETGIVRSRHGAEGRGVTVGIPGTPGGFDSRRPQDYKGGAKL